MIVFDPGRPKESVIQASEEAVASLIRDLTERAYAMFKLSQLNAHNRLLFAGGFSFYTESFQMINSEMLRIFQADFSGRADITLLPGTRALDRTVFKYDWYYFKISTTLFGCWP